jgi:guanylate cyclase
MFRSQLSSVFRFITRIGAEARDSDDVRLQKTLLVSIASMIAPFAVLWGLLYMAFDEPLGGSIPLLYAAVSCLSIIVFAYTRRYRFFRFSQHLLILLLPFLLMWTLGGFINASGVIIWSLLSPLGALLFDDARHALRWFLAYLGLVLVSGLLQLSAPASNHLPHWLVIIFFVMNLGAVSGIIIILLYYFVSQRDTAFRLLRGEQEKAENLLLNILPKDIATILKNENRVIADHYEGASILFADVVNFTPMSATMTPVELVELLNEVFSHFDTLVEQYGLEKIKTIGDCYMVASGVPHPRADHAQAIVRMALEMRDYISQREFRGRRLAFRIGINSGPVVAGVIGRKKFIYDLWGDAVNTASRMESHGTGGLIQVTRQTYELIQDDFVCEPRGVVNVKGKGEMDVWQVVGRKASLA